MNRGTELDVFQNLIRAHELYWGESARFLKRHNLTMQQHNVLCILDQHDNDEGLPMLAIADRLVNRVPDVTRLVDRMERRGWVTRTRSQEDRRVVLVNITREGKALASVQVSLKKFHKKQFGHMNNDELLELNLLLQRLLEREL
ncbi:MAG: MarR family transcriptional regulator [Myxococcota bacterium]